MKNITVTVPDDVYRTARMRAAASGTSVSSLVSRYLRSLTDDQDAEFARLEALQREAQRKIRHSSAGDRLSRDEVHDRAALR